MSNGLFRVKGFNFVNLQTDFSGTFTYLGVGNPVKVGILDDRLIPLPFLVNLMEILFRNVFVD
jgi:hypothetical protein